MFLWNGTDITNIISKCDIYEAKYNKHKYWVIRLDTNEEITCIVRSAKNAVSCLIDELKPVFGLQKMGTHWCRHKGRYQILIRCIMTPEGYVKDEISLNMVKEVSPLLRLQVQEIFTFRELLGINCSYDSSIILREGKSGIYPISFYDPSMTTDDKKVIPFTILEEWFENTSIDEVVQRIVKIRKINKLGKVLHNIRKQIDEIIERVDRETVTYKSCILNRITERLQTTLDQ